MCLISPPSFAESQDTIIAVSVFDNETGLPEHDRLVAGLSDLVVERLTKLDPERIAVIGNAAILRQPRNIRNLKAVSANLSADYVLLGQLQQGESGLRFITHFIRLQGRSAPESQSADDRGRETHRARGRGGRGIRASGARTRPQSSSQLTERLTTYDPEGNLPCPERARFAITRAEVKIHVASAPFVSIVLKASFLSLSALGVSMIAAKAWGQAPPPAVRDPGADALPQQDPALVKDAVGASHGNFARIRELVEKQPAMARASIDWGFGDWETCIDAAAHVGNKPIADFLLTNGARPTIFSAAMMGQLDAVKAFIAARPGIQKTLGPHGITLMSHAKAGGPDAAAVVQYLATLGDADTPTATSRWRRPIVMRSSASTSTVPVRAISSPSTCSRICSTARASASASIARTVRRGAGWDTSATWCFFRPACRPRRSPLRARAARSHS